MLALRALLSLRLIAHLHHVQPPSTRVVFCRVMQFFVSTLLPKYGFKTGKWASFQRNLNIYGFVRVPPDAPNAGFYINPCVLSTPPSQS